MKTFRMVSDKGARPITRQSKTVLREEMQRKLELGVPLTRAQRRMLEKQTKSCQ